MLSMANLVALLWVALAMMSPSIASASTPGNFRVRGVVSNTRHERALKSASVNKSDNKAKVKERSYPPGSEFLGRSAKAAAKAAKGVSGRASCVEEARSTAKGVSGASGRSNKSARVRRERGLKGKSVARSAEGVKCASLGDEGVPDREYPPPELMAASSSGDLVLGASAEGCARSGRSGKSSKRTRRRTRGLKSSKRGTGARSIDEECVESASFNGKSGNTNNQSGKEGVTGASVLNYAKSAKLKSKEASKAQSAGGLPARDYPPESGPVEQASGAGGGGVTAPGTQTVVREARTVPCSDIFGGVIPSADSDQIHQYEISADMQVQTTETYTMNNFYEAFHAYLQKEVAMDIAGCPSPDHVVASKVTGVQFLRPYSDPTTSCSPTTEVEEDFVWTDPELNKRANERQSEYAAPAGKEPAGEEDLATAELGQDAVAAPASGGDGCAHVLVPVNIYHSADATETEVSQARSSLENEVNQAKMNEILSMTNSEFSETAASTTVASASAVQSEPSDSGKKIGFSLGILGIVLVSLAVVKVAFNRKRNKERTKGMFSHHHMGDEPDDTTFVYPAEDELLGPEFSDEFDEAYQNYQYGRNGEPKGSAYILDDLQDGMSVETGSDGSYASSRHPMTFRQVASTPSNLHRKGCC